MVLRDGASAEIDIGAPWIHQVASFWQLLAEALDNILSPTEWSNGRLRSTEE